MSELETHYLQEDKKICPEEPRDLEYSIHYKSNADSPVTSSVRKELSSRIHQTSSDTEREDVSEVYEGPVYTKRDAMMLAILFSLKTMESLGKWVPTPI